MKAVILAGGFGTRLRKIVFDRPKSMALFAGIPFLEHQIRLLKEQGIKDIVICVSYMSEKIKSYFGDGRRIGVNITYSDEEAPMGTAGAIKLASKYLQGTFIVLNGDSYSQIDLNDFIEFHKSNSSHFSMSLTKAQKSISYGSVVLQGNKVVDFLEKSVEGSGIINSGVYIFEPKIFDYIPYGKNVSLEKDIFPQLAKDGLLYGYPYNGYFMDIGLPDTYEKFKQDVLESLMLQETNNIRDALKKIDKNGINLVLITDHQKKLLGMLGEKEINQFIIRGGNLDQELKKVMNTNYVPLPHTYTEEDLDRVFDLGFEHIPILDEEGIIKDVEFYVEEIQSVVLPILRGKAPLRISFAGGGTDIPYFFDKYGGAVVSATIDKYCYATIVKRADRKIIIDSDTTSGVDVTVSSIDELEYDGRFDLVKAVIKKMKPEFGFELHLHNDIPPGRGLGSSASLAVLIVSLLNNLMDTKYNDYKIAEVAYKAEREEMKIKGGWQDQYASITGGFNYMEFNPERTIVYPLRLKEEVLHELHSHLMLCYVGKSHQSTLIQQNLENNFKNREEDITAHLTRLKENAIKIRDSLLTNQLEIFGKLLHESWESKKQLDSTISNYTIDKLYEVGINNGAYGGKLLGAGDGGYILFFHQPRRRNELKHALEKAGGEILAFNFDFQGTKVWNVKEKF